MKIQIISVSKRVPEWVDLAWDEYAKRFGTDVKIEHKEVKSAPRVGKSVEQILEVERKRIEDVMAKDLMIIALDEHGKTMNTKQLAHQLQTWKLQGCDIAFVIGGPDGLCNELKNKAAMRLRLSDFALPHFMARILLIEQIYRVNLMGLGHPYHRE